MKYRRYGTTGKQVSEIGFGAWQLGNKQDWAGMEDDEAIRLVHEALDLGVNFLIPLPITGKAKARSYSAKRWNENGTKRSSIRSSVIPRKGPIIPHLRSAIRWNAA